MLNTDLHSSEIKPEQKMTLPQFLKNNRGINGGENLPVEYMTKIYNRILKDEIKMETETNMYANAEKKGYLVKQGGRIKTWKKRWFVVKDNCLYYFRTHEVKKLLKFR
jgi:cytohesin